MNIYRTGFAAVSLEKHINILTQYVREIMLYKCQHLNIFRANILKLVSTFFLYKILFFKIRDLEFFDTSDLYCRLW